MTTNNEPRNPMDSIQTHDFLTPKGRTKKPTMVRRSYWITRDLDKKIKLLKTERVTHTEAEIVQEALTEYFGNQYA